ncbi:hypothetical protein ACIGFK_06050 [Streptomyces sp. NPDC085524]|uniref:hypothetical protein n=1 Tax=Streptomyces sp. NPDC085524 TaxID=3365728 RepID=UPI0037D19514
MNTGLLRRFATGRTLALGAVLALAVPATAYANTVGVTVKTPGATTGPGSADSEISTHADCSSGLISGVGLDQAIGTGASVNGNHVNGTSPSSDGTTAYTGSTGVVGTDVTHWLGIGGSGGQVNASFSTTPYAMCFTSSLIDHTQVVMNKANTPTAGATAGLVTATCPANTRLLGGGARTTPGTTGSLKTIASFPTFNNSAHGFGAKAAADGETNPDSWSAVGWDSGANGANYTYAYAICSADGIDLKHVATTVRFTEVDGPNTASTGTTATTGCSRADGQLVSGGAAISGGNVTTTDFGKATSGGPHLNGSFPSDAAGTPFADGSSNPSYWTASTHSGGSPSQGSYSDVWALCLDVQHGHKK